ncbi:m39 protein [Murid betaherpesvirus 1]|uniref:M39 protein n=1 Tax=Murid herpesvirus 1 TaxID=10366 RepID=H2A274_MUHV1|nr:m39 protein [Murid betaherpesvirus 1]
MLCAQLLGILFGVTHLLVRGEDAVRIFVRGKERVITTYRYGIDKMPEFTNGSSMCCGQCDLIGHNTIVRQGLAPEYAVLCVIGGFTAGVFFAFLVDRIVGSPLPVTFAEGGRALLASAFPFLRKKWYSDEALSPTVQVVCTDLDPEMGLPQQSHPPPPPPAAAKVFVGGDLSKKSKARQAVAIADALEMQMMRSAGAHGGAAGGQYPLPRFQLQQSDEDDDYDGVDDGCYENVTVHNF